MKLLDKPPVVGQHVCFADGWSKNGKPRPWIEAVVKEVRGHICTLETYGGAIVLAPWYGLKAGK